MIRGAYTPSLRGSNSTLLEDVSSDFWGSSALRTATESVEMGYTLQPPETNMVLKMSHLFWGDVSSLFVPRLPAYPQRELKFTVYTAVGDA